MTTAPTLRELWADIAALRRAESILHWDQETMMPPKGQAARGAALATLAGVVREKLAAPELLEAAERQAALAPDGSAEDREAKLVRTDILRATAVPADLTRRVAEASSSSVASWIAAKEADDFSLFRDELAQMLELKREVAAALVDAGIADDAYDALLDEYEPGMRRAQLTPLFASLQQELVPLVQAVADSGRTVDESPMQGSFPAADQEDLCRFAADAIGYDFDAGRLDRSAHPFTSTLGHGDVRVTWFLEDDDVRPALLSTMHEAGHAMYEQGLPAEHAASLLGGATSMGVHESQSRLWENQVGRSKPFWEWFLPHFIDHFPGKSGLDVDAVWRSLHTCRPSFIRVEADEATYNLHVIARYEIELAIVDGEVGVDDLPGLWDDTYERLLGIRPPKPSVGILQDIHWAAGLLGYFPTYTLGNLFGAQLFGALGRAVDVDAAMRAGDFTPILAWLRTNVHQHGSRLDAPTLIEAATGAPPAADDLLAHLRATLGEVYGIDG